MLKSKVDVFVDLFRMRHQVEETSRAEQRCAMPISGPSLIGCGSQRELDASRERQAAIIHSLPMCSTWRRAARPRRPRFLSGDFEA